MAILRRVGPSLKPHGRLGIVDFIKGAGGPGPAPDQRVDREAIVRAATAAGLTLVTREDVLPFQFLLVFEPNR